MKEGIFINSMRQPPTGMYNKIKKGKISFNALCGPDVCALITSPNATGTAVRTDERVLCVVSGRESAVRVGLARKFYLKSYVANYPLIICSFFFGGEGVWELNGYQETEVLATENGERWGQTVRERNVLCVCVV